MPRPRRRRRIHGPPRFDHFKPVGVPRRLLETLTLSVDEFEAIRLADLEGLDQERAAEKMNISRPTFSRLVETARGKVARVLVEGRELRIEGGAVDFIHTVRRCRDCGDEALDPLPAGDTDPETGERCHVCGSDNLEDLAFNVMRGGGRQRHGRRGGAS